MTAELTTEEIVTNLLSSNEFIKKKSKDNFYLTNKNSLGEFLKTLPIEEINVDFDSETLAKYSFIKNKWII